MNIRSTISDVLLLLAGLRPSGIGTAMLFNARFALRAIIAFSIVVSVVSFRFVVLGFPDAFPGLVAHLDARWWTFASHVAAASIALLTGGLQLVESIRKKRPAWHRWCGRVYAVAVLIGGVSGLALAFNAIGGPLAGTGFGLMAVLWVACTLQGVRFARSRRFAEHRRWMIRSFALTFAAVTFRLYLAGFMITGSEYGPASVIIAWICWVPNLLFAQWWLSRHPNLPRMARAQAVAS